LKNIIKNLILVFFPLTIQAQKTFLVTIQFPKNINIENIRIGYGNGKERIDFPTNFIKKNIVLGTYYSKYHIIFRKIHVSICQFFSQPSKYDSLKTVSTTKIQKHLL
jgi:hypothetical protein